MSTLLNVRRFGFLLVVAICWLQFSRADAGFTQVFTDNNMDGLIDDDFTANNGANYIGVPVPTNSQAGYNSFVSALGPNADIGIEGFERFPSVNPFGVDGMAVNLNLQFDRIPPKVGSLPITGKLIGTGVIADLTDPPTVMGAPMNPDNESGRFAVTVPIGGTQYFSTNFTQLAFTITFSEPVSAFGFFGTDFGDFNGQSIIEVTTGSGMVESIVMPHQRTNEGGIANSLNATLLFYGLVGDGDTIKSAAFKNVGGIFDRFGFDNLVVAISNIPEPSSALLLGLGAIGLCGCGRRRRRGCTTC